MLARVEFGVVVALGLVVVSSLGQNTAGTVLSNLSS